MPSQKPLSLFLCTVLLGLALSPSLTAQDTKPLTNQDVIQLVKLGLSAEIINAKIAESPASFDLSVAGLTTLAQNKVPNEVIKAMQVKSSNSTGRPSATGGENTAAAKSATAAAKTSTVPLPPDKGVYLWDGKQMHLLTQSRVPSMGQSGWRSITPFVKKKIGRAHV